MINLLNENGQYYFTTTEDLFIAKGDVFSPRVSITLRVTQNFVESDKFVLRVDPTKELISNGVLVSSNLIETGQPTEIVLAVYNADSSRNWMDYKWGITLKKGDKLATLTLIKKEKAELTMS